jgi:tellurite methyltransferase
MTTDPDDGWAAYYTATRGHPPRPLLIRATALLDAPGEAMDLGCGAGNETRYLLGRGFRVTAVDADPAAVRDLKQIRDTRLRVEQATFETFAFEPARYDLVNAQLSLPFTTPAEFDAVFDRLRAALRRGGIFCGDLWGPHDDWNVPDSGLTFHTREGALRLLQDLNLLEFREVEEDVQLAIRGSRHAHWYEIIARRDT